MHLSLLKKLNSDRQTECAQVLLTLLVIVIVTIIVLISIHLTWSLGFSCQGTLPYLPLIMSDASPEVFHSSLHRGSSDLPQWHSEVTEAEYKVTGSERSKEPQTQTGGMDAAVLRLCLVPCL